MNALLTFLGILLIVAGVPIAIVWIVTRRWDGPGK